MSEPTYPKDRKTRSQRREGIWAMQFIAALHKSGLANTLGRDVCWLLTVIASVEDAQHYRGPIDFWGPQLMTACGFTSKETFRKARKAAVDSGWLVHIEGAKGRAALYWTTCPKSFEGLFRNEHSGGNAGPNSVQQIEFSGPDPVQQTDTDETFWTRSGPQTGPATGSHPTHTLNPKNIGGAALPDTPPKRFRKPTVQEVRDYATEKGFKNLDPEHFVDHYEGNGWMRGKSPIKDWRAVVRTWMRKDGAGSGGPQSSGNDELWSKVVAVCNRINLEDQGYLAKIKKEFGDKVGGVILSLTVRAIKAAADQNVNGKSFALKDLGEKFRKGLEA